jgi:hypothetical protein
MSPGTHSGAFFICPENLATEGNRENEQKAMMVKKCRKKILKQSEKLTNFPVASSL